MMVAVERRLLGALIILRAPVIDQAFEVLKIGSEGPIRIKDFIGPTRCVEASFKVVQRRIIDLDLE